MNYSMNELYEVVGISKQAVHRYAQRQVILEDRLEVLVKEVEDLRKEHPGCGVEKMYYTLAPNWLGRDKFISIFMDMGFRLKKHRNYRKTTLASKLYYPNKIKGLTVSNPNEIWQSDITYIEVGNRFYYAVFIIDVYTKEIVGYRVSNHMRATANVKALQSAIKKYGSPNIHHSDRGSQYIYKGYIKLLEEHATEISMGLTAQDNAYAERINKTIKEEYLSYWDIQNYEQLKRKVTKAVHHYNRKRLHNHIGRKTPQDFREYVLSLEEQDRPTVTIYTDVKNKMDGASSPIHFKQDLTLVQNCLMSKKDKKQKIDFLT